MEDEKIVELYWVRSEQAVAETAVKYSRYCRMVAQNILGDAHDSEECVNDTWLRAWNSIPPARPERLRAYLARITRNLALHRAEQRSALKRGGGQYAQTLEELRQCVPVGDDPAEGIILTELLERFLADLQPDARRLFLRRYWYMCSIRELAAEEKTNESTVKMRLMRMRQALREYLEKEGVAL